MLSAEFGLYFLSGLQTRWAHRPESLCSVSGSEYFIRSSSAVQLPERFGAEL
jgi:hypothetical protein